MSHDIQPPETDRNFRGYFLLVSEGDSKTQKSGFDYARHFHLLWSHRGLLAAFMAAGLALGAVFTFGIAKPLYRAQAIVSVRSAKNSMSGLLSQQFSGLSALAGVDLAGGGGQDSEEMAILSSKNIAKILVVKDKMIPVLYPRNTSFFGLIKVAPPTVEAAAQRVIDHIRIVEKDKKTGLITVTMVWRDPGLAAKWTEDLVSITNAFMRARAAGEAQKNIEYLQREGQTTSVDSVRQALVRLTETNLNQAMLANVQTDFAFKMVDPPEIPEEKDYIYPNHLIFLATGLVLGLLAGVATVYWLSRRHFGYGADFQ